MARRAYGVTAASTTIGQENFSVSGVVDPVAGSTYGTDRTNVDANVATLVADGATPTQAHVTTLNTNWGLLKADIPTERAALPDLVVSIDAAKFPTVSNVRAAFNRILAALSADGAFKP